MRDMFSHNKTVPAQWHMATLPHFFTKHEMRFGRFVEENETVADSYDPMCATLSRGCYPVLIIDPAKLIDPDYGPAEARKLFELVNGTQGFENWMIDEEVSYSNEIIFFHAGYIVLIRYKETHHIVLRAHPDLIVNPKGMGMYLERTHHQ